MRKAGLKPGGALGVWAGLQLAAARLAKGTGLVHVARQGWAGRRPMAYDDGRQRQGGKAGICNARAGGRGLMAK